MQSLNIFIQELATKDFALLEQPNGDLQIFIGPFLESSELITKTPTIFFNNFFLDAAKPFLSTETVVCISAEERKSYKKQIHVKPEITWTDSSEDSFLKSFRFFTQLIKDDQLKKAVPVSFVSGVSKNYSIAEILERLIIGRAGLYSYALKKVDFMTCGATPEILFAYNAAENMLTSEAVAGSLLTAQDSSQEITERLEEEHQLVVDDLEEQLSTLGIVKKGKVTLKQLTHLSHLRTPFSVPLDKPLDFLETIKKLHPTGALGILPRVLLHSDLVQCLDNTKQRAEFGAPFGAMLANGDAVVLVAIRNLRLSKDQIRIGAGAGLTRQSTENTELHEIRVKLESIKDFFWS